MLTVVNDYSIVELSFHYMHVTSTEYHCYIACYVGERLFNFSS